MSRIEQPFRATTHDKKRIVLDVGTHRRIAMALNRTYQHIGGDCWGERTPPDNEYADVVIDRLHAEGELSSADYELFTSLSYAAKRRLALEVGP